MGALLEALAPVLRLVGPFGAGQVDHEETTLLHAHAQVVFGVDGYGVLNGDAEESVASRRGLVHGGGLDGARLVALLEEQHDLKQKVVTNTSRYGICYCKAGFGLLGPHS